MSLQIAILGMLWEKESHPYEIKKRFQHYNLDTVVTITDGALYYNFDSLLKKGYIEQREVVHSDNRPDKTMYAITQKGRQGLKEEIYNSFKKYTEIRSLYSVIPFIRLVEHDRLAILIEDILKKLYQRVDLIEKNRFEFPELTKLEEIQFLANYSEEGLKNDIEAFRKLLTIVKEM